MWRHCCFEHIFSRTLTGIDETACAQFLPCIPINRPPLGLHIRRKRTRPVGSLVPLQAKPLQVHNNCVAKLGSASREIEIFDAQNQAAASCTRTLLRAPKRHGMTDVQIASGRRRDSTAIVFACHPERTRGTSDENDEIRMTKDKGNRE